MSAIRTDAPAGPSRSLSFMAMLSLCSGPREMIVLVLALGVAIIYGLVVPSQAVLLGNIFEAFSQFRSGKEDASIFVGAMEHHCGALLAFGLLMWALSSGHSFLWMVYGELRANSLRARLFSVLLRKEFYWFDRQEGGVAALVPRVHTLVQDVENSLSDIGDTVQSVVSVVSSLTLAFHFSWKLSLLSIVSFPICAAVMSVTSNSVQPHLLSYADSLLAMSEAATNTIRSIDNVKYFNAEEHEVSTYRDKILFSTTKYMKVVLYRAAEIAGVRSLTYLLFVQVFWAGSSLVHTGELTPNQVLASFWACFEAVRSIEIVIPCIDELQKGMTSLACLFESTSDADTGTGFYGLTPSHCTGSVQMNDMTFSYPSRPDVPILTNCNLFFPPGRITFVVGQSGSGKSTLGQLLLKFYSPESGSIYIDGKPLEMLSTAWVRENVTVVQQQSFLFNSTLRQNISSGFTKDVTDDQVFDSVRFASLEEVVCGLPDGLETVMKSCGSSLSGGQQQRVALARARLRNTPITLFDESTSALDHYTRTIIMNRIREWRGNKTTIVITHDMTQVDNGDLVYHMTKGSAVCCEYAESGRDQSGDKTLHEKSGSHYEELHQSLMMTRRENSMTSESTTMKKTSATPPNNQTESIDDGEASEHSLPMILSVVPKYLGFHGKFLLTVGFIMSCLEAAVTPVFSYAFGQLLGTYMNNKDPSQRARKWSLVICGLTLVNGFISFLAYYLLEHCAQTWVSVLRSAAMKRILERPKEWFEHDENTQPTLTIVLDKYTEEMRDIISRFAGMIFTAVSMMVIAISWALAMSWRPTSIGLACAPLMYMLGRKFNAVCESCEKRVNDATENAAGVFSETFVHLGAIRALTLEGQSQFKYSKSNRNITKVGFERACYSGLFSGLSRASIVFVFALVFYYGARLSSSMESQTETILTVLSMLIFSISNASYMISFVPRMNVATETSRRVLSLVHLPADSHELSGTILNSDLLPIRLENIHFRYPARPEQPVLSGLTVTICPGYTAIVGPSGSGKSTLVSLLCKLYQPATGIITFDGIDIYNLHTGSLRSRLAVVPQQPTIYPATIAANVIYGLPPDSSYAQPAHIEAACRAAGNLDAFVSSLPQGYATHLGEAGGSGVNLSGGQAARLALARALVRRPDALLLDEPTANLDRGSARCVRETVSRLVRKGEVRAVVVVTHVHEMMKEADTIVVVKRGVVVEEGGFVELMKRPGGELRRLLFHV